MSTWVHFWCKAVFHDVALMKPKLIATTCSISQQLVYIVLVKDEKNKCHTFKTLLSTTLFFLCIVEWFYYLHIFGGYI